MEKGQEEQVLAEGLEEEIGAEGSLGGLLEGGGLTHTDRGVKSPREKSSPPGACGDPGS